MWGTIMHCNKCHTGTEFYKGNPTICKECFKARNKLWQSKNYPRVRAHASKSAALSRGAVECTCCKISDFIPMFEDAIASGKEVDHIVPCTQGGKHCVSNLQLLSREDNILKGDRNV